MHARMSEQTGQRLGQRNAWRSDLGRRLASAIIGGATTLSALAPALAMAVGLSASPAAAVTIELKDVAPDRIERQRAFALGNLPLPGTPDMANLEQRLATKQLKPGDQVFIRIFKAEAELEIWMKRGPKFVLLDIYPICHFSGTVGPKVHEGDKQSPEGFYSVGRKQLHLFGRHPRSLDLGFPNSLDQVHNRTGSFILIHGGCSSVGCFAMTNTVTTEIYDLSERALKAGQDRVHVHVFPFRMTDANLTSYQSNPWIGFWRNLKQGYDAFEQTRMPPKVSICGKNYVIQRTAPGEVGDSGPLALCGDSRAAMSQASFPSVAPLSQLSTQPSPASQPTLSQPTKASTNDQSSLSLPLQPSSELNQSAHAPPFQSNPRLQFQPLQQVSQQSAGQVPSGQSQRALLPPPFRLGASPAAQPQAPQQNRSPLLASPNLSGSQLDRDQAKAAPTCDPARPSCRRYSSLQSKLMTAAKARPFKTARATSR
jgi:murein L,D-transpeptidase YafK